LVESGPSLVAASSIYTCAIRKHDSIYSLYAFIFVYQTQNIFLTN